MLPIGRIWVISAVEEIQATFGMHSVVFSDFAECVEPEMSRILRNTWKADPYAVWNAPWTQQSRV